MTPNPDASTGTLAAAAREAKTALDNGWVEGTQETCTCRKHDDGSRTWDGECPDHGRAWIKTQLLPVGTRIRSIRHPEFTGYIKDLEWADRRAGLISPIPYLIGWDNSDRACDLRGWLFVYACVEDIERIPDQLDAATGQGRR